MGRTIIPQGAILNCYLPKKEGSIKRGLMNLEAKIMQKKMGGKLLNHTAIIENTGSNILIWEAGVTRGVCSTELSLYSNDVHFCITTHPNNKAGLLKVKGESGKKYDIKSWFKYAGFLITKKWRGAESEAEYSEQWYCSELVYWANQLGVDIELATPNHVWLATNQNEIWSGTYNDFVTQLAEGTILFEI